jgi:putative oxidoreductase
MKTISTVARYIMGLMFTVFGLNGFVHFLPMQPMPEQAGKFIGMLASTNYMVPVFALQLVGGLLLLAGRYVPLALTLLAPVIVNILIFHILMAPAGLAPGVLATLCWLAVFTSVRSAFAGLFQAKVVESGPLSSSAGPRIAGTTD